MSKKKKEQTEFTWEMMIHLLPKLENFLAAKQSLAFHVTERSKGDYKQKKQVRTMWLLERPFLPLQNRKENPPNLRS